MKTSFLIIAAFAALVAADVTITDLPSCAITCATSASSDAGCDISDIGCFCSSDTFATSMYACVPQSCSADDQNTTFTVAEELCAQAGVPDEALQSETAAANSTDAATDAPASATPTASATSMDKTETAAAMTTTTSSIPEQGLYAGAGTTVTVTAPCSESSISSNSTATMATASVVAYTGAASNVQVGVGMLALLGFAVL